MSLIQKFDRPQILMCPQPVPKPDRPTGIHGLPVLPRMVVALAYAVRSAEYAISPGGHLRAFGRAFLHVIILGVMAGLVLVMGVGILWLVVSGLLPVIHLLVKVLEGILTAMVLMIVIVAVFGIFREKSLRRR